MNDSRRPSAGYLLSLTVACTAIPSTAIALGAGWNAHHGVDPANAIGGVGAAALVLGYGLLFAMRLIFWPKASQAVQSLVRTIVSVVLAGSLLATAFALWSLTRNGGFLVVWFTVLAALCQIGTAVWLIRYRSE